MVANRKRLAVDNAENRAEGAVGDFRPSAVADRKRGFAEGAFRKADRFRFGCADLVACGRIDVAIGIEFPRVLPLVRIKASSEGWRESIDIAVCAVDGLQLMKGGKDCLGSEKSRETAP